MTRIVHENGVIELIAAEGMEITNGESYSVDLFVGLHGDESKWYEITEEEAERRKREAEQDDDIDNTEAFNIIFGEGEQ